MKYNKYLFSSRRNSFFGVLEVWKPLV